MGKYLDDAVYIMVTKESYDLLQKYKEEELKSNPAHFGDEPLASEPFYNGMEHRIYAHRVHLLKAYKLKEDRNGWILGDDEFCDNDFIKTASDNDFFEQLFDLLATHNL